MTMPNNTQIDNAKDIDVVIPVYNLIEYCDNYSKTSGSLWQHYRVSHLYTLLALLSIFLMIITIIVFRLYLNKKIMGQKGDNGISDVVIMVLLKKLRVIFGKLLKCH